MSGADGTAARGEAWSGPLLQRLLNFQDCLDAQPSCFSLSKGFACSRTPAAHAAAAVSPLKRSAVAPFFVPPFLSANNRPPSALQVREEIITNVQATYKETDLFKMFQTGDLANLDALPPEQAAKLASVFRLRQAIYSPDFRSFISQVTGGW